MTEALQRPGPGSVIALASLGVAVFVVPQLFCQPGFLDSVDAAVRPGGELVTAGLGDVLAGRVGGTYAPLAYLSFRIDHGLAGAAGLGGELAAVMHLHSLLLHLLTGVLVLVLLRRMGIAGHRALAGAAVYLVHPVMLETATVIGARPALLCLLFQVLALVLAWSYGRSGRATTLAAVALCAAAAAAASPQALALPLLALVAGARRAGAGRAAVAMLLGAGAVWTAGWVLAGPPFTGFDRDGTVGTLRALLWPGTGDTLLAPAASSATLGVATLASLLALAGCALRLRRSWPGIAAGCGVLLVAAGLGGTTLGAAEGLRAPDVAAGLAVLGAGTLLAAIPWPRAATVAVAAAAVLACAVIDVGHAPRYQSGHSLWGGRDRDDRVLWAGLADRSPVAAALFARQLAAGPLDPELRRGLELLDGALADLPEGDLKLRALETRVELLARLGRASEASDAAEAMCALGEKLGAAPERQLGLYLRTAECFSVEDSRAKIDEYFARARRLAPEHPEVIAAGAERDYVALVQALRRERQDPNLDVAPGWLAAAEPRLPPIRATLQRVLARDPDCYRALVLSGRISEATGAVLSAVPFYERAIASRPRRVEAHVLLATLFVANQQLAAAESRIQSALAAGLDDPALHYVLANLYAMQGRRDDARRYLETYLRNRPGNQSAKVLLANLLAAEALAKADRLEVAELKQLADRITTLNPDDPKGLMVRAAVLCKDRPRDYVGAIVLLEQVLERIPGNPDAVRQLASAHRDFGWALVLTGKKEQGMDHFEKFLAIAPPDVPREAVHNAMVAHCQALDKRGYQELRAGDKGDSGVAEAAFRRSSELLPERPDPHYLLGLTLLGQAKPREAIPCFEQAILRGKELGGDISHYVLPLVGTLRDVGESKEAKRRGEAFLAAPGQADPATLERIRELVR